MRRSLIYFWRMNLAVALGAAITTAVLTGALIVGDSMRGSLRQLTVERLGGIDHALVSQRFFREDLADRMGRTGVFRDRFSSVAPAIVLEGSARGAESGTPAAGVRVYGFDERFQHIYGGDETDLPEFEPDGANPLFSPVAINLALQQELGLQPGDSLLLSFPQPNQVHSEFLLGSRDPVNLSKTARLTVVDVIPNRGLGRLGLEPHQGQPLNVYLPLTVLQQAVNRPERVNSLFASGSSERADIERLQQALREAIQLDDLDLVTRSGDDDLVLESREMVIPPPLEEGAREAADHLRLPVRRVLTHLANTIHNGDRSIPYSTVTAMDFPDDESDALLAVDGQRLPPPGPDEVYLNSWAAEDLQARPGDLIELTYYVLGPGEQLETESRRFRLAGVAAMSDLGAEPSLTPEIPGIHDAENMSAWDPPVPVDLNQIRHRDEDYWDRHRAAPKAFLAYPTGLELWETRFGRVTSLRIGMAEGLNLEAGRDRFEAALLERFPPSRLGLSFQPVKEQGLRAAEGTTDFGVLFIGFSFFLIVSAALLVGLLFKLGVEQRARQVGLLLSVGYPLRRVRRGFLAEGALISGIGGLVGVAGAVAYAEAMIHGLKTWWSAAVGPPFLSVQLHPSTLAVGFLVSLLVVSISIWWALRGLARIPPPLLLAGSTSRSETAPAPGWVRVLAWGSLGAAGALLFGAFLTSATSSVGLFFGVGTSLLVAGLSFFGVWMQSFRHASIRPGSFALGLRMAARSSARNPGRSLLCAALVAGACFVIVAVGANRREPVAELLGRESGSGGFSLLARSDIPLYHDLSDPEGRFELGFADSDSARLQGIEIFSFRVRHGQDVSCLNLYRPQVPRLLGAPVELLERGGFQFQRTLEQTENPWRLLEVDLGPGVVPAFADANSAQWVLHLGLGEDLVIESDQGEEVRLRLVGLLNRSIFQSELIVSEADFLRLFPTLGGYSYFLVEAPRAETDEVSELLENSLSDFGFHVVPTAKVLSNYLAVENTYLSTFQTLGGLGLLLGTVGLGIVLARNVLERRGELATLRAFGFRRSRLARLVVAENGFLLLFGVALGTVSALVAVIPHLAGGDTPFPWMGLALTLLTVLAVGLAAGAVAVSLALRVPLLPALRAE